MRRMTFTSALLETRRLEKLGPPGYPAQSKRGDEHHCCRCGKLPGTVPTLDGRMECLPCAEAREPSR